MAQAAMIAGTAMSLETAYTQSRLEKAAGRQAAREAEIVAKQEEVGAIQREADRKARLSEALATQSATVGASGIAAFEGSPLTILEESIKAEETATERDIFMTRLSAMSTRAKGQMEKQASKLRALMTLTSGTGQAAVSGAQYGQIQ